MPGVLSLSGCAGSAAQLSWRRIAVPTTPNKSTLFFAPAASQFWHKIVFLHKQKKMDLNPPMAVEQLEDADLLRCLEAEKERLRELDAHLKQLSASRLAARQTVATYQRELVSRARLARTTGQGQAPPAPPRQPPDLPAEGTRRVTRSSLMPAAAASPAADPCKIASAATAWWAVNLIGVKRAGRTERANSREASATDAQAPDRARGGHHRISKDTGRTPCADSTHGRMARPPATDDTSPLQLGDSAR